MDNNLQIKPEICIILIMGTAFMIDSVATHSEVMRNYMFASHIERGLIAGQRQICERQFGMLMEDRLITYTLTKL